MRRRGTRSRSHAALALGAWVAALLAPGATAAAPRSKELEALRSAIEERREAVAAFEREERGLFDAIEAVDGAIRAARAELSRAAAEAEAAREAASALEARSADLEERLDRTREALARRAVALYKAGEVGPVRLVFAPGSLRDRLGRIQVLQRLMDHDGRLLARYDAEYAALERARTEARAAAEQAERARADFRARRAGLERERAAKRDLLADVRRDRARERAVLNELEAAARALEETLAHLRELPEPVAPDPATGFARLRGRLDAPVVGPVLRRFGRLVDAEFRTETFRKGIDFGVETGDPVYAVAAGSVRFAGWFRGYGNLVILDHGDDYFTVSGHLDEILVEVGDRVAAGDRIALAGETGSLTGPRLYFEIRKGGEALDPGGWLRLLPGG